MNIRQFVFTFGIAIAISCRVAFAVGPGDYNNDGIVSHADFSVLGDNFECSWSC